MNRRLVVLLTTLLMTVPMTAVGGVVAAGTASAADPGARPGNYVGKSQGSYRVTFTVVSRAIQRFDTAVVAYCTDASGTQPLVKRVYPGTIPLRTDGRFDRTRTTSVSGGTLTVRVVGNIDGSTLKSGRISYRYRKAGIECVTDGPQPFTAQRRA